MNKNKFIALVTALCFLYTSVVFPAVQSTLTAAPSPSELPIEGALIPPGLGRITASEDFNNGTLVINIQDLHCHPEVQRNIARILSALDRDHGLTRIYVEGGYGDVDTSWLCSLSDPAVKKLAAEKLLEQGMLTGTEYYSVMSNRPHLLKGLENRTLHQQNVIRLEKILSNRPVYEARLRELEGDLRHMKLQYLSAQHRRFDQLVAEHRRSGIRSDRYYELLAQYAAAINKRKRPDRYASLISFTVADYPNITAYIELSRLSKNLNYRRISRQTQEIIHLLKERVPFTAYQALLANITNVPDSDAFYLQLAQLTRSAGLREREASRFNELFRFFDYLERNRTVNPVQLVNEEKRLTEAIRIALSRDVSELEISFLSDFFGYFQDYLLNRLTADDYAYFSQRFDEFRYIWGKYANRDRIDALADDFCLLNDFYRVNTERNDCFLNTLAETLPASAAQAPAKNADAAAAPQPKKLQIIVMVTGGFHSDGLNKLFSQRHLSHLTITPNITKDAAFATRLYDALAKEQASIFTRQMLALALGSTDARVVAATKDTLVVKMNGREIRLQLNDDRTLRLPLHSAAGADHDAALETALKEAVRIYNALLDLQNPLATADLILRLAEAFSVRAAADGIYGGNGLIWEIATDKEVQDTIMRQKGIAPEELDLVGETMQLIVKNDAAQMQALEAAARKSPLMNALANTSGLKRFMKTGTARRVRKQKRGTLEDAITDIDRAIKEKKADKDTADEPFFIYIAGKSSSGKSSKVSNELARRYHVKKIINLDNYYLEKEARKERAGDNFDIPQAFDWDLLKKDMKTLKERKGIHIPEYSFTLSDRTGYQEESFYPGDVVILEGLFPLQDVIADEGDYNIFVDVDRLGQLVRRLVRDVQEGRTGQSFRDVLQQMFTQVVPAEKEYTEPTKKNADLIISQNYVAEEEAPRIGRYELQAKARINGLDEAALEKTGAKRVGTVQHTDRYYTPGDKDLTATGETLRIREENGVAGMTYKGPQMASQVRYRPKLKLPFENDWLPLVEKDYLLATQISKKRTIYKIGENIRIHLDVVDDLGTFVEIATSITRDDRHPEALEEERRKAETVIHNLFNVLGIPLENITNDTYEMLARAAGAHDHSSALQNAADTDRDPEEDDEETAAPSDWFYSPSEKIWVRSGPLKITDPGVKEAATELGIKLWWDDEGRIAKIDFYDTKRLLNKLGLDIMSPAQYWQVLKDAADTGDEAMVKELNSNRYAEWLDVLFYEEDERHFMVAHPTIKADGTWDREADAGRIHPVEMPRGRYGWLQFENFTEIFNVINMEMGFPLEGAVQKRHAREGIVFKYWDIYDSTKIKAGIIGYVTSSGTKSLDFGIPLATANAPLLMVRAYRRTAPTAGFDPDLLKRFGKLERAYNTAMKGKKFARFYERKEELFGIVDDLLKDPGNVALIRNSQDNTFIKLREKLTDMLGFVQINALHEQDQATLDRATRTGRELFGIAQDRVTYDGFVDFVSTGRQRLKDALKDQKRIVFVMGHRSPDTDTVISSLFEAYRNQLINPDVVYIPVVQAKQIPDEVRQLLNNRHISDNIFLDTTADGGQDPLYTEAMDSGLANWVLVDQNVSHVQKFVISILDHHTASEAARRQDVAKTIEIVGSTTGMVVQRFLGEGLRLEGELSRIAYGATLMDTEDMNEEKMTFKDEVIMAQLRASAGFSAGNWKEASTEFYQKLMSKLLSTDDAQLLFDRDYKEDWGFGFAVAKLKGMFDGEGKVLKQNALDTFMDLAQKNNAGKNLPLTLVKVVDYKDNNETVNRERLYLVFGEDAQQEFKDEIFALFTTILGNEFRNKGLIVKEHREAGYIEWYGVGKQLSRKKVAPLLQPVVHAFNKYFHSKELGIYVSRDFLKPGRKLEEAAKKLNLTLSTNSDGNINYLSPQEIMLLMKEMGYSIMTLREYAIVREEAKKKKDLEMLASLESHGFVEVLSTVVLNYDPETGEGDVIEHPDVTKDAQGNYNIGGIRKRMKVPRGEPGLIIWDDVDKKTGLPSIVFDPTNPPDPEADYTRYWSPEAGIDSVFTRGSIFVYKITAMDGKVHIEEAHPNLGARFYRTDNEIPFILTRVIDGKVVTEIQSEGVLQRYQNGVLQGTLPYTSITDEINKQLLDVDAKTHTLDLMPYVEANVPSTVLETIKKHRVDRVEIHYGPQQHVIEQNPGLLKGYRDYSMRDPDAARIGWYMKEEADGKASIVITDVRGTTKILHLLYVLRFLGISGVPVYDYHFDFEKFAEETIAAAMKGEKPGVIAIGKSIFERKLLRKVKYALIYRQIEKEMKKARTGSVRDLLRSHIRAAGTKKIDETALDEFFATPFVKKTLDRMQSIVDERPDMRTLLTYWYYGDIMEDYIRIITTLNTNTIEITKFAKMLQKDLQHVSVSEEGTVAYLEDGEPVTADLSGILTVENGREVRFKDTPGAIAVPSRLGASIKKIYDYVFSFSGRLAALNDYAAKEPQKLFIPEIIDPDIIGMHLLKYPVNGELTKTETAVVGRYPFGTLAADFVLAGAKLGASRYVHAGSAGLFFRDLDEIKTFRLRQADLIIPERIFSKGGQLLTALDYQPLLDAATDVLTRSKRPFRVLRRENGELRVVAGLQKGRNPDDLINIILTDHVVVDSPLEEDARLVNSYFAQGIGSVDVETGKAVELLRLHGLDMNYRFMFWVADLPGKEGDTLASEKQLHPIADQTRMRKVQGLMSDIFLSLQMADADKAGNIVNENNDINSDGKKIPMAFRHGNLKKIGTWAAEGWRAWHIAVYIGLVKELLFSYLRPFTFINEHPDKEAAWFIVVSGYVFALASIVFFFVTAPAVSPLINILAGLVAGALVNGSVHAYIDWHFIKASGITDAVQEFGAATVDAKGDVHTNLYILDEKTENMNDWGWQNTGWHIGGKRIWASTKAHALVLFVDGKNGIQVAQHIKESLTKKGGIAGSRRMIREFARLFKKVDADLDIAGLKPGMIIDSTANDRRRTPYYKNGSMVIPVNYFGDTPEKRQATLPVKLGELMTRRNAEAVAMPKSIYIQMDDAINEREDIEAFNQAGNGQIIIDPVNFKNFKMNDSQIRELARSYRRSGVLAAIDLSKETGNALETAAERFSALGFPAYYDGEKIHVFTVNRAGFEVRTVSGYEDAAALQNMLRDAQGTAVILKLSELKGLLKGGERAITDRVALAEILKTTVLSFYSRETLTNDYVASVGYAWNRDQLPPLPEDIAALERSLKLGDIKQIQEAMGIQGQAHPVNAYLENLRDELAGTEDEAQLPGLQRAFLKAITEMMLAKEELDRRGKRSGLADRQLEIILGQKLLQQQAFTAEERSMVSPADLNLDLPQGKPTAEDVFNALYIKVAKLSAREKDPMAINAIIELIAAKAELKIPFDQQKNDAFIDVRSVNAILQAA